jgi:hypothetical protein
MEKPTIYIVVEDGLVQDVFVKAHWAADAEVVLCDKDTTDSVEKTVVDKLVKQLPEIAHHVY